MHTEKWKYGATLFSNNFQKHFLVSTTHNTIFTFRGGGETMVLLNRGNMGGGGGGGGIYPMKLLVNI